MKLRENENVDRIVCQKRLNLGNMVLAGKRGRGMKSNTSALILVAISGLSLIASALGSNALALDPDAAKQDVGTTIRLDLPQQSTSTSTADINVNDAIKEALSSGKTISADDIGKQLGDVLDLPPDIGAAVNKVLGGATVSTNDIGKQLGDVLGGKTINSEIGKQIDSVLGGNNSVIGKTLGTIFTGIGSNTLPGIILGSTGGGGVLGGLFGGGSNNATQTGGNSTVAGGTAASGTIASQTCDTQVWRAMESRAHLETEREIMQNQNLIFKADSILNYTCFDSFAAHATKHVGILFTHTSYFSGSPIIPWGKEYGMDYNMNEVIIKSMEPYIETNFDHTYLGGRGVHLGLGKPVINEIPNKGGQYKCDVMNEVWKVAKCMNFMHTKEFAATDGFYPFTDLKSLSGKKEEDVAGYGNATDTGVKDTRHFPTACGGQPVYDSTWNNLYRRSRNENNLGTNDALYAYGDPLRKTYKAVRDLIQPAGTCGTAIKTGVQVILNAGGGAGGYPDGVCTNPGCSYTRNGTCSTAGPGANANTSTGG